VLFEDAAEPQKGGAQEMTKLNVWKRMFPERTHEGAVAQKVNAKAELRRSVLTCLLWEDTFYEKGNAIATRIAELVKRNEPEDVAALAREARDEMQLRHVPLFLVRELARRKGTGPLVAETLQHVIQRADELGEFVAIYWREMKQPLSAGVKRGLARAFAKFDAYQLAKYDRDSVVTLRDVLFLCHAKPRDAEQAAVWKQLVEGTLEAPDTWEVSLSAQKDKKETFERLLSEGKLGGMAVLRNLRLMSAAGVSPALIRERLSKGVARGLPFRFVTAARFAPKFEEALETAMLKGISGLKKLPGATGLLVDVSGSMDSALSAKSETKRMDAAAGLAILLREKCDTFVVATFSETCVELPARRGFALRDAIVESQAHSATYLKRALTQLRESTDWRALDRLIVITDEQAHDGILPAWTAKAYVVNVAPYKNGLSYGNGWTHVDGWSERVVDYIAGVEKEAAE
jgi:60 kDa SS-A/Ro ribonucleoprotein